MPETPIRDIVDQCRVWESHADTDAQRIVKPTTEKAWPMYTVNEPACVPADQVVAAVGAPSVGLCEIEALLKCLLPTTPVQAPPPRPVPTKMEIMLESLLSNAPAPAALPPRTAITEMETMLQCLLPGAPTQTLRPCPVPKLVETFPGWSAEKFGASYMMISPHVAVERLRAGNGD